MTRGMILGKFLPPHLGHIYLGEFARNAVDELTIVVHSRASDPIPAPVRVEWLRELFPFDRVVHLADELPPDPQDHADGWDCWRTSLLRVLPGPPDLVFAASDDGPRLARELGAEFVPVDRARGLGPVSGARIRRDPIRHWDDLPRCVRPYFVRRVCLFGPESTGKTTLARQLADHFGTVAVPEYARTLIEARGAELDASDVSRIARGQIASETALARNARGVLFCDTDVLATTIWADVLYGSCPEWVQNEANRRTYDLYLLLKADVPWVGDPARCMPDNRHGFSDLCRQALEVRGRRFVTIQGNWYERFRAAVTAVEALIQSPPGDRRGPHG